MICSFGRVVTETTLAVDQRTHGQAYGKGMCVCVCVCMCVLVEEEDEVPLVVGEHCAWRDALRVVGLEPQVAEPQFAGYVQPHSLRE